MTDEPETIEGSLVASAETGSTDDPVVETPGDQEEGDVDCGSFGTIVVVVVVDDDVVLPGSFFLACREVLLNPGGFFFPFMLSGFFSFSSSCSARFGFFVLGCFLPFFDSFCC